MLNESLSFRYYLFSLSNLIAAFGGGLILGKGVGIIDYPYLQGGSILAFFIGTILGLLFLQLIPQRLSESVTKSFSISGGITSLILFYIYQNYSQSAKLTGMSALVFFLVLSIRFGFWFYSRAMRASKASSYQQSIAWVEFGYYLGMVLGLVIWKLLGINFGLSTAFIIDAVFQFIAGTLDIKNFKPETPSSDNLKQQIPSIPESQSIQYSFGWCWKLAGAVVFLTIGIQIVIFNAAHYVAEVFGAYILATFYLGVATAAFTCNKYKTFIFWNDENNTAFICLNSKTNKVSINLLSLLFVSVLAVIVVISQIFLNKLFGNDAILNHSLVYAFVFIAAFIYEALSLSLLDRIDREETLLNGSGMIMRTYGFMGLGAAIGFWTLSLIDDHLTSSIITLAVCIFFTTIAVLKRNPAKLKVNQINKVIDI